MKLSVTLLKLILMLPNWVYGKEWLLQLLLKYLIIKAFTQTSSKIKKKAKFDA